MRGEIHALLGENGAGKSTIIKIIGGIQSQDEGVMLLAGEECRFSSYRDAIARGIGIVFQEFSLVPDLDAVDNIFLGRESRNAFGLSRRAFMVRQAAALFERIGVHIDLSVPVGRLSVAEQQFVEIAKHSRLMCVFSFLTSQRHLLPPTRRICCFVSCDSCVMME
ncbi:ATP-binding cassette domain-containing protein [Asaia prunellae]|uniref:ATP-binding cassette domain-containing protein n=1 Tax=Asaia prunellae TaxID=610245 RepID=UPI000A7054B3|nr:ATP-binding cassette domain-containing protein [Asaia prunellae]